MLTNRELNRLRKKPNKSLTDWEKLHTAGWADRTYNSQNKPIYTINRIGLAGGAENFYRDLAHDRRQGIGPL